MVAWLVDCGIPRRLANNRLMATENRIMETSEKPIISAGSNSFPTVVAVALPAIKAPANTMIPKNPGIKLFRIIFAPKAAEKEGEVPLPPMLMARKIPIR